MGADAGMWHSAIPALLTEEPAPVGGDVAAPILRACW